MSSPVRLPREVWIATLTQAGIQGGNCDEITRSAIRQMEGFLPLQPDIFCLPETFHYWNIPAPRPRAALLAAWEGPIVEAIAAFARRNNCYVICPIHTQDTGRCYNAAVVIDRKGKRIGEYRKFRTTVEEMVEASSRRSRPHGVSDRFRNNRHPDMLRYRMAVGVAEARRKGAEIVFWPSAFGGGERLRSMAWLNRYCVVTSTIKGTSRILDVTGETVAETGQFNPSGVCASVNLEKALLHTWPYVLKFPEIQKKYGRSVRISSQHEEEFSLVESLSPDVKIAAILREFEIETYDEHLLSAEAEQRRIRQGRS